MAEPGQTTSKYRPAPLASLPPTLDPAEYDSSPEKRRAAAERLAIRARLKRHYLLQLNDPRRTHLIVSAGPGGRRVGGPLLQLERPRLPRALQAQSEAGQGAFPRPRQAEGVAGLSAAPGKAF